MPLRGAAIQQFLALVGAAPAILKLTKIPNKDIGVLKTAKENDMWYSHSEGLIASEKEWPRRLMLLTREKAATLIRHNKLRSPLQLNNKLFHFNPDLPTRRDYQTFGRSLAFLHKNGLRHGDLSSSNIIRTRKGTKFMDFETANLQEKERTVFRFKTGLEDFFEQSPLQEFDIDSEKMHEMDIVSEINLMGRTQLDKKIEIKRLMKEFDKHWKLQDISRYQLLIGTNELRQLPNIKNYPKFFKSKKARKTYERAVQRQFEKSIDRENADRAAAAAAYVEEIQADPLTFNGRSIFDYKKLPFVKDVKGKKRR